MTVKVGVIILAHTALYRVEQTAKFWTDAGCSVQIHVDTRQSDTTLSALQNELKDNSLVECKSKFRCEWGTWGIVAATIDAAKRLLKRVPDLTHVLLTSGLCIPLRNPDQLIDYLKKHPNTDYIESMLFGGAPWTKGGLNEERLSLYFPFSWKQNRVLFDGLVKLQRKFGIKRRPPHNLPTRIGSQWWCLTAPTLHSIISDPNLPEYIKFFRTTWIPDETFFQSLSRKHSNSIASRSLTLSKFDAQGKPHTFYCDHIGLLERSTFFLARKAWPKADRLYSHFLSGPKSESGRNADHQILRAFAKSNIAHSNGRSGLYMQTRYPIDRPWERETARSYLMLFGYCNLFSTASVNRYARAIANNGDFICPPNISVADFEQRCLEDEADIVLTKLSSDWALQDLQNHIWYNRQKRVVLLADEETPEDILYFCSRDPNCTIRAIFNSWLVNLATTTSKSSNLPSVSLQKCSAEYNFWSNVVKNGTRHRVHSFPFVGHEKDAFSNKVESLLVPKDCDMSRVNEVTESIKRAGINLQNQYV